ncbi:hypothetical protein [Bacillus thuringiensis]|uniref:hypothetical protein n=1 Tax=Bacillus thuringiensis TaxID=1428 RepID=UPI000BA26320|nr:hypothetical protein [Bacillus thuringiensis]
MSFLVSKGTEAVEDALKEKVDNSKLLKKISAGTVLKVRALPTAVVKYHAHSAFKKFNTTPCTKPAGKEDLYDKACDLLYKDAKAAEEAGADAKEVEAMRNVAYQLKAKERYLIGFVNLEDGKPIVVDFTAKQGKAVVAELQKRKTKLSRFAFELTKTGSSTDTVVSFGVVLDMEEDLTDKEREHFEKSADFEFDMSVFETVFSVNKEDKQLEDLRAFGFDVSRLGFDEGIETEGEEKKEEDEDF